jgi:hypothetical protein
MIAMPFGAAPIARQSTPVSLSMADGVRTMRMVASAEVELAASAGRGYGDLSAIGDKLESGLKVADPSSGVIRDYALRITLSADRQHFQASLVPITPHGCTDLAWFVDDRFVIYSGQPIC